MDRRTTTPESLPATSARPTALELLPSFRRHLAAENKAPRTARRTPRVSAGSMSS
jgi:hypothetical protein